MVQTAIYFSQKRDPYIVFGIIALFGTFASAFWKFANKFDFARKGISLPTAWLIIVPIASFYFNWEYARAVETLSKKRISSIAVFVLLELSFVISWIIIFLIQPRLSAHYLLVWALLPRVIEGIVCAFIQQILNDAPLAVIPTDQAETNPDLSS